MNIFDFLRDIISKKQGNLLNDTDNKKEFNLYMLQRWLSFFDPDYIKLLNQTSNRLYSIFNSPESQYQFLLTLIPKTRFKKIYYIKKAKEKKLDDKQTMTEICTYLAKNQELSQREVQQYIELMNLDIKDLKKRL